MPGTWSEGGAETIRTQERGASGTGDAEEGEGQETQAQRRPRVSSAASRPRGTRVGR